MEVIQGGLLVKTPRITSAFRQGDSDGATRCSILALRYAASCYSGKMHGDKPERKSQVMRRTCTVMLSGPPRCLATSTSPRQASDG